YSLRYALQTAERISKSYTVSPLEAKAEAVLVAAKAAHTPPTNQAVADEILKLVSQAEGVDDYDLALRLVKEARAAAAKTRKAAYADTVTARNAQVSAAAAEFASVKGALAVLQKDPQDEAANLKVGLFRCLHQDNFDEGLSFLARGSNPLFKGLA